MIYKIPDTFKKILKRYGSRDNGYVFLLLLRRKWLIKNDYLTGEAAKKLFPSCEMCVGKCVVTGDLVAMKRKEKEEKGFPWYVDLVIIGGLTFVGAIAVKTLIEKKL